MRSDCARMGILIALSLLALTESLRAEKPTKAEIAAAGKAATAYVEVPNQGSGSAFCVHPSGLFVTNEHVVHDQSKREIVLVLDPGMNKQRVLKARVVRVDESRDLALLRVENAGEFPSLNLGSVDGIAELMDVVAFGFPLGRALSPDKNEYPAISVNSGRVTALRHKAGELQRIQIDVALTFGNSGGPVLDDGGKIVGVVVSGVRGAQGINQAIPVSHLDAFLKTPDLQITLPELTSKNLDKSHEFKARVVSLLPLTEAMDLELTLKVDDEPERRHKMEFKDGYFRVSTTIIAPDRAGMLDVSAQFDESKIRGTANDQEIQVGTRKIHLSECRRIQLNPKPAVELQDGKTLEGKAEGLSKVSLRVGGQNLTIDLGGATSIFIQAHNPVKSVQCTIVAVQDGNVIGRVETSMDIRGTVPHTPDLPDEPDAPGVKELPQQKPATSLVKAKSLPKEWTCPSGFAPETDQGIRINNGTLIISKDGDFLNKSFVLEVVLTMKQKDGIAIIGFGDVNTGGGNDPPGGIRMRIHPPGLADGEVYFTKDRTTLSQNRVFSQPGTHLFRITKEGTSVTLSVDVDMDGESPDDSKFVFPNVSEALPGLHRKNGQLFFGGGGVFKSVSLTTTDGK